MMKKTVRFAPGAACALALGCSFALGGDAWSPPAGYYDGATGTGATLKAQLYDIMRMGHIQRSYGDFRESAFLHDADPSQPGNILLGYDRRSVGGEWDQGSTWNREHVWPQSRQPGSASNSTRGNLGDPHALRPMNPQVNSARGNKPLGLATTIGPHRSLGTYYFVGEMDRGDIARSLFYSETRYGPQLGLELVSSFPSGNQMGDLPCLLAWHYLDPPDEFERRRNHVISSFAENPLYYTNNRNAYVDRPELVWSVYVDQANDARLYVGDAPAADGGSVALLDAGATFVGAGAIETTVTVNRDGDDGTYFRAIAVGDATLSSSALGAFAIGGADEAAVELSFDAAVTSTPGVKTADLLIDNLDVTTGGGPGRGALDADDLASVELTVYERAEGSLDGASDLNELVINFGVLDQGPGTSFREFFVHNLPEAGLTADLDVELAGISGDADRFVTDLVSEQVGAGSSIPVVIEMKTDAAGDFGAALMFDVWDDRTIPGAESGSTLVVYAVGRVRAACLGDLDGSGAIGAADLAALVASWGGPGAGDLDGDGAVGASDLAALLAGWGPCE